MPSCRDTSPTTYQPRTIDYNLRTGQTTLLIDGVAELVYYPSDHQ